MITKLLSILILCLFTLACSPANNPSDKKLFSQIYQALPELRPIDQHKTHTIRILYVEDPSLPKLSDQQKTKLLDSTVRLTKSLLGYAIRFEVKGTESIQSFFSRMSQHFDEPGFRYPVTEWPINLGDSSKIRSTIAKQMSNHDKQTLIKYFGSPHTGVSMADHVFRQFMMRLTAIYNEKDLRGQKLLTTERLKYMSYAHWAVIAYHLQKADFVITNSIIAGADTGMPLYVINRGGVTSAFVENNLHNSFQATGVFATYQYLSQSKHFKAVRGPLPSAKLIPAMSHLFVHELGHYLRRAKEYYALKGSVHSAPRDLNYLKWLQNIDPKIHPMPSDKLKTLKKF